MRQLEFGESGNPDFAKNPKLTAELKSLRGRYQDFVKQTAPQPPPAPQRTTPRPVRQTAGSGTSGGVSLSSGPPSGPDEGPSEVSSQLAELNDKIDRSNELLEKIANKESAAPVAGKAGRSEPGNPPKGGKAFGGDKRLLPNERLFWDTDAAQDDTETEIVDAEAESKDAPKEA